MHVAIVKRCRAEASWPRTRMNTRSVLPRHSSLPAIRSTGRLRRSESRCGTISRDETNICRPAGFNSPSSSSHAGCGQLADIQFQPRTDEGRAAPDAGRGRSHHATGCGAWAKALAKGQKKTAARAFSSEVDTGSREGNASKQRDRASVRIQSERKKLWGALLRRSGTCRIRLSESPRPPEGGYANETFLPQKDAEEWGIDIDRRRDRQGANQHRMHRRSNRI